MNQDKSEVQIANEAAQRTISMSPSVSSPSRYAHDEADEGNHRRVEEEEEQLLAGGTAENYGHGGDQYGRSLDHDSEMDCDDASVGDDWGAQEEEEGEWAAKEGEGYMKRHFRFTPIILYNKIQDSIGIASQNGFIERGSRMLAIGRLSEVFITVSSL